MPDSAGRDMVASPRHFLVFLGILTLLVLAGSMAQHPHTSDGAPAGSRVHVIPLYLSATAMNWLLVYFVWRGTRRRGTTLRELIRGRWAGGRDVARDIVLALGCWGVLLAIVWIMDRLAGPGGEESMGALLPGSPGEVMVWLATSASAGFCEELVFRGYLQRQLLGLTRNGPLSVLGQGVVFGLTHAYQGWGPVLRICVIGVFLGAVAAWRKSLRVGMIVHGWQDVWAGWLSRVLLR